MNQKEGPLDAVKPSPEAAQDGEPTKQEETAESQEQPRQEAWAARKDLIAHGPDFVSTLVERDQYGQTGGAHYGDTIYNLGGRTETPRYVSVPIPTADVEALQAVFHESPSFHKALARLRSDKIVFLAGGRETGRRSAALMLLHRLGIDRIRALDSGTPFSALPDQLDASAGYIVHDLAVSRSRPLREPHLLALRDRLERTDARLVIVVEPSAALGSIPAVRWEPPSAKDMLHSHVTPSTGESAWDKLCGLTPVEEFLARPHPPNAIKEFAGRVVSYHLEEIDEEDLAAFGKTAVTTQVTRWLTEEKPDLRDKAFLVSLAIFDKAPYAVTAELSDGLFLRLRKTEDPGVLPGIPVFGSSREDRLRLAHAEGYVTAEITEWGPLNGKFCASFRDGSTARILLEEVWNLHPSARPALAGWIRTLAEDRRPLVRTRAASAAALLATADLSSTMAHLIEPWADARDFNSWLTAANALTMAQLLGVPVVLPILRDWCTGENESRRWTAVRAYGLLGPVLHQKVLDALLDAIHQQPPAETEDDGMDEDYGMPEEAKQFADALELLLLAVREPVLSRLAERLPTDRVVRTHALLAFLQACGQSKEDDSDRSFVLDWYAQALAAEDTATARHLTSFWAALLADRRYNVSALAILRRWVFAADHDPEFETALSALLPALSTTPTDHRRVSHMLRMVRDSGRTPSPAAGRLLKRLPPDRPAQGGRP